MSEKLTDLWVFNELVSKGFVNASGQAQISSLSFWAERSNDSGIDDLLSTASKRGTRNPGKPEYIIHDSDTNLLIIVENKRDVNRHIFEENPFKRASEFAVNGALWYARALHTDYNVIAVACSGTEPLNRRIDTFGWKKGVDTFTNLNVHEILDIDSYRDLLSDPTTVSAPEARRKLLESANAINEFMHGEMNIIEHNRLLVLGSILVALEDPVFKSSYSSYNTNADIADFLSTTLSRRIRGSVAVEKQLIDEQIRPVLRGLGNPDRSILQRKYPKGTLHKLILDVDRILYNHYEDSELDLVSMFFNVFLSYSTKGGSDLGIVLTPQHVTRLFTDIAGLDLGSKILDICAGTGGFLAAAWRRIALSSEYADRQKQEFKSRNLFGVEIEPSVYTVAALNMFLHKDGQSNFINADCFSKMDTIRAWECNVGFINPPYSNPTYSEIAFVELMLDSLLPGSIGIAILPVNAVSTRTKRHSDVQDCKNRIFNKHTLHASIEMPKNLFFPKGTETIVLVFQTGAAHKGETWMAEFNDGYSLIRHQKTRTPTKDSEHFYSEFMDAYRVRTETSFSFMTAVQASDQWVYTLFRNEEYKVTDADLQWTLNEYAAYLITNQYI